MKEVELYTDGACSGNPGPGGWGAILRWAGKEKELSGGEPSTTNNRMELTAVIEGLAPGEVRLGAWPSRASGKRTLRPASCGGL